MNTHKFKSGVIKKFNAMPDIADTWKRLMSNDIAKTVIMWIKYEYAESLTMNGLEVEYELAHEIVNELYN